MTGECMRVCFGLKHVRMTPYVMTGAGVPVDSHSSSTGLLIKTVRPVTSSAPSMKGGTERGKNT